MCLITEIWFSNKISDSSSLTYGVVREPKP